MTKALARWSRSGGYGRPIGWAVISLSLAACVRDEGCGNELGPEGGMAISNSETCPGFWADVRVPEGALDHAVEATVSCADVPEDFTGESLGPIYEFAPTDLRLLTLATFTLQYSGDELVDVLWRTANDDSVDWTRVGVSLIRTRYSDGRPAVRFEFDRFGYFVVVRP